MGLQHIPFVLGKLSTTAAVKLTTEHSHRPQRGTASHLRTASGVMRMRLIAATLALSTVMSGCNAKSEEVKIDTAGYAKPAGWQTECIGRWLVDVPSPIDLGSSFFTTGSYPEFFDYTPSRLRESTRSRGAVTIGPVRFSESDVQRGSINEPGFESPVPKFLLMVGHLTAIQFNYSGGSSEEYRRRKQFAPQTDRFQNWVGPGKFQISFHADDERGRFYWRDQSQLKIDTSPPGEHPVRKQLAVDEPLAREVLKNLVPRYRVRKPGDLPQGPGICTPHGFFADPSGSIERDSRVSVSFVDPRYANLAVHVEIMTRMPHTETALVPTEDIRKAITPWDAAEEIAREHKARCRSQQGTASRGLFGSCAFAGATGIDSHWNVQYLKLANGQEARALAVTYPGSINNHKVYEAIIETAGKKGSITEPRIVITVEGFSGLSDEAAFRGKEPPPLQDAFKLALAVAKSLRQRPQAIDPAKPVVDSWAKFRQ